MFHKTFFKIPSGKTSWNVRCCVQFHYVVKGHVKPGNMHVLRKDSRNVLTRKAKWEKLATGKKKRERRRPFWVGSWNCVKVFSPFPSQTYKHTGSSLWAPSGPGKLVSLKLVMWLHPFFKTAPVFTFLLLWHPAQFQISLIGGQKQDKIRGGSSVFNQEGLTGRKIGSAATGKRMVKEFIGLHLSASKDEKSHL